MDITIYALENYRSMTTNSIRHRTKESRTNASRNPELLTYVISKSSKSMSFGRTSPKALWNKIVCKMPANQTISD